MFRFLIRRLLIAIPTMFLVVTLAFCRSGTRSIISWSLGQLQAGARSREDLVQLGEAAGYDLSMALPR